MARKQSLCNWSFVIYQGFPFGLLHFVNVLYRLWEKMFPLINLHIAVLSRCTWTEQWLKSRSSHFKSVIFWYTKPKRLFYLPCLPISISIVKTKKIYSLWTKRIALHGLSVGSAVQKCRRCFRIAAKHIHSRNERSVTWAERESFSFTEKQSDSVFLKGMDDFVLVFCKT